MTRGKAIWLVLFFCALLPIAALAQAPSCIMSITPNSGAAPLGVTATGSCTAGAAPILAASIDWGDGTAASAVPDPSSFSNIPHTYQVAGTFDATVTATDALLQSATSAPARVNV